MNDATTEVMKGMLASVLRHATGEDFTIGGASSRHNTILVIGEVRGPDGRMVHIPEIFIPNGRPVFRLDYCFGWRLLPVEVSEADRRKCGPMFGGNFAYTCDSRWPSGQPIAILDRYEPASFEVPIRFVPAEPIPVPVDAEPEPFITPLCECGEPTCLGACGMPAEGC